MGLILFPNGMPGTLERQTLSKDEIKIVTEFEAWCKRRRLVLDLICQDCLEAGHASSSRCSGNNGRDSNTYKITCAHAERVYGAV